MTTFPNLINIYSIGFNLTKCGVIGVADLHALGYAHTDIKVDNIFVDNGTAFLSDLEYIVATSAPARLEGPGLVAAAVLIAQEQDLAQLGLLSGDVLRL